MFLRGRRERKGGSAYIFLEGTLRIKLITFCIGIELYGCIWVFVFVYLELIISIVLVMVNMSLSITLAQLSMSPISFKLWFRFSHSFTHLRACFDKITDCPLSFEIWKLSSLWLINISETPIKLNMYNNCVIIHDDNRYLPPLRHSTREFVTPPTDSRVSFFRLSAFARDTSLSNLCAS